MNNIISTLKNELNIIKDKNKKLNFKLLALKKIVNEYDENNKIHINTIEKLNNKVEQLSKDNNSKIEQIIYLVNNLKEKEEEIKSLKSNFNKVEKEKNSMKIFLMSEDESIFQPFICKKFDTILDLKKMIINRFPEYNEGEISFYINGMISIDITKNLEENHIN